jgi:DNA-binding transcriptional ArsR family regulator
MIMITMRQRKVRRDSILHELPSAQRAMVDKWLFDKGMTYEAVAEGCGRMFGIKVSRSSVGRYYERQVLQRTAKVSEGVGKCVSEKARAQSMDAGEELSGWARDMCVGMLEGRGTTDTAEAYRKTLARMTHWALEEMKWVEAGEGDLKGILRVMRILIEARRERNERAMVELRREKFQMGAARECFKHLQEVSSLKFSVSSGSGSGGRRRRETDEERARRHCRETWYLGV